MSTKHAVGSRIWTVHNTFDVRESYEDIKKEISASDFSGWLQVSLYQVPRSKKSELVFFLLNASLIIQICENHEHAPEHQTI